MSSAASRRLILLGLLCVAASASAEQERFELREEGRFGKTGQPIEFFSRYGWESYQVNLNFGVEEGELTKDSTLDVWINKTEGRRWSYRCRLGDGATQARVKNISKDWVSVLFECKIKPSRFAKAAGVETDMVADPRLVYQVIIREGAPSSGAWKGFYLLPGARLSAMEMNTYAAQRTEKSRLTVIFKSAPVRNSRGAAKASFRE